MHCSDDGPAAALQAAERVLQRQDAAPHVGAYGAWARARARARAAVAAGGSDGAQAAAELGCQVLDVDAGAEVAALPAHYHLPARMQHMA